MSARSAPSITRVHTLHRIRTVVNHVESLQRKQKKVIDDFAVANHLIRTQLSRPTTQKLRDQIGRRARDHLETARYLGLLFRHKFGRKYTHKVTRYVKFLSKSFEDECPANSEEESILIDRVCRFKMANASYIQSSSFYKDYRTRPCLNVLASLKFSGSSLNVFQLGYILSEQKLDIAISRNKVQTLVNKVKGKQFENVYLAQLSEADKRNVRRDTLPFVDWCAQLNLVKKNGDEKTITEIGKKALENYESIFPLWWTDLGRYKELMAAAIILINYFKMKRRKRLIDEMCALNVKWRLIPVGIGDEVRKVLKNRDTDFVKDDTLFDFSFQYDIPPEAWGEVQDIIRYLLVKLRYKRFRLTAIQTAMDDFLASTIREYLRKEAQILSEKYSEKAEVPIEISSVAITSQFKSPYEATSYVFLKAMEKEGFKIAKYQRQLTDFFEKRRWKKFAEDNPDMLLTNDFWGLVECKSTEEWGERFKLNKKTMAEISYYNDYAKEIINTGLRNKCKSVFCYEGQIEPREKTELEKILKQEFPNVLIITRKALQKALSDQAYRNKCRDIFKMEPNQISHQIVDI